MGLPSSVAVAPKMGAPGLWPIYGPYSKKMILLKMGMLLWTKYMRLLRERLVIIERGWPCCYYKDEIFLELLKTGVLENIQYVAMLFMINDPTKMRVFFGVPINQYVIHICYTIIQYVIHICLYIGRLFLNSNMLVLAIYLLALLFIRRILHWLQNKVFSFNRLKCSWTKHV